MLCCSLALSINTVWVPTHSTWQIHGGVTAELRKSGGAGAQTIHSATCPAYLREAHQHQKGEEVGAFQRLRQLLNTVVREGSDHRAPLRTSIQTV